MTKQQKDLKQLERLLNKVVSHEPKHPPKKPKKAPSKAELEKAYIFDGEKIVEA